MFSCEIFKIYKNTFFYRTPTVATCLFPNFQQNLTYRRTRISYIFSKAAYVTLKLQPEAMDKDKYINKNVNM